MDAAMVVPKTIDSISSCDLAEHALDATSRGIAVEAASYQLREGEQLVTEWLEILYIPSDLRAAASWGADAIWFDANSIDHALETWLAAQNGDEDAIAHIEAN